MLDLSFWMMQERDSRVPQAVAIAHGLLVQMGAVFRLGDDATVLRLTA